MKKVLIFLSLASILCSMGIAYGQSWQELGSDHFINHFTQDKKFAQEILDKAEVYYQRIALDLGYPRYSEFWTWDNRVGIYIYPDKPSFLKATNQPEWSQGMADYTNRQIASFLGSKEFVDSILPHEIAHLIFRDFVGFKGEIPLWLDEGVAQWEEEAKREDMKSMIRQLYNEDKLLLLDDLMKLDLKIFKEMDRVYIRTTRSKSGEYVILFLSTDVLVATYYLEAVSLIGFLIERYGSTQFAAFCRELRDGKNLEEALRCTYPNHVRNLKELEDKWREYLAEVNKGG